MQSLDLKPISPASPCLPIRATDQRLIGARDRRVIGSSIALVGAKIASMLAILIQVPLVLRTLGAEGYGAWVVLISLFSLFLLADLGIGLTLQNNIASFFGKDDWKSIARTAHVSRTLLLWIGTTVGTVLSILSILPSSAAVLGVKSLGNTDEFRWVLIATSLIIGGCLATSAGMKIATGLQRGWLVAYFTAGQTVGALVFVALSARWHAGLLVFVLSSLGPQFVSSFLLDLWIKRYTSKHWSGTILLVAGEKRAMLTHSLWYVIPQVGGAFMVFGPVILVSGLLGAELVAPFNLGQRLFGLLTQTISIAVTPLWPAFGEAKARGDLVWIKRTLKLVHRAALVTGIIAFPLLAVFGRWLLVHWVGPASPIPGSTMMILLAIWAFLQWIAQPQAMLAGAFGRMKPMTFSTLGWLCTVAVGSTLLAPRFQTIGVLWSLIAATFVFQAAACFWFAFQSIQQLSLKKAAAERQPPLSS